jgi:hypothetical protein
MGRMDGLKEIAPTAAIPAIPAAAIEAALFARSAEKPAITRAWTLVPQAFVILSKVWLVTALILGIAEQSSSAGGKFISKLRLLCAGRFTIRRSFGEGEALPRKETVNGFSTGRGGISTDG